MHTKLTSNNNFFRKADLKHLAHKCKTKDLFYMSLFNELHLYLHPDTELVKTVVAAIWSFHIISYDFDF